MNDNVLPFQKKKEHSVPDYKLDTKAHESHRLELPSPAFSVGLYDEQMGHRNVS